MSAIDKETKSGNYQKWSKVKGRTHDGKSAGNFVTNKNKTSITVDEMSKVKEHVNQSDDEKSAGNSNDETTEFKIGEVFSLPAESYLYQPSAKETPKSVEELLDGKGKTAYLSQVKCKPCSVEVTNIDSLLKGRTKVSYKTWTRRSETYSAKFKKRKCLLSSSGPRSKRKKVEDSYNVDSNGISVSGISSGAAMATQLHVIYSKTIMGTGLIAGVPFSCSGGSIAGALACMNSPSIESVNTFITLTITGGWFGNVDSTLNLRDAKVYIFSGTKDTVVLPGNGPHIQQYYSHFISDSNDIKTVFNINAEHSMPTENYGGSCDQLEHTYFINNCNYHAAYDLLNHIYGGNLQKPSSATVANGQLLTFDQSEFFHLSIPATYSMDSIGYIYVPSGCVDKSNQCKLHVALHGCQMGRVRINDTYVKHAGYNEVGELNNIIILYPQAIATTLNPKGCWDWWGYTGTLFATNKGFQPTALKRMIDRAVQ